MIHKELPIPPHFNPNKVGKVWRVPYQERAAQARKWAEQQNISSASEDARRVCLLLIDVQNTFCIPDFELFVGGRSGNGAVDDNHRLCEFIYRNLGVITEICPTLDTHQALQIFHTVFLVNEDGNHPEPYSLISIDDIENGVWKFNPAIGKSIGIDTETGQKYLTHYVNRLQQGGKFELTIWPYHAMLGGIGHALVSAVEEAIFFHSVARYSQPEFQIKGKNPLTENYSVLSPEVLQDANSKTIAQKNTELIKKLIDFNAIIIAGQAKSHCVAFTVSDLLKEMRTIDEKLVNKVTLLEDCMSPVVIPDGIDYTDITNQTFAEFAEAGMNIVQSTIEFLQ